MQYVQCAMCNVQYAEAAELCTIAWPYHPPSLNPISPIPHWSKPRWQVIHCCRKKKKKKKAVVPSQCRSQEATARSHQKHGCASGVSASIGYWLPPSHFCQYVVLQHHVLWIYCNWNLSNSSFGVAFVLKAEPTGENIALTTTTPTATAQTITQLIQAYGGRQYGKKA
jgi:hypothetical protein